jgi:hypothetical protein
MLGEGEREIRVGHELKDKVWGGIEGQVAGGEGGEGEEKSINIEKKARKMRKEKR